MTSSGATSAAEIGREGLDGESGSGAVGAGAALARGAEAGVAGRASNVPVSRSRNFRQVGRGRPGASGLGASGSSADRSSGCRSSIRSWPSALPRNAIDRTQRAVSTRAGLVEAAGASLSRGVASASFTGTWEGRAGRPRGALGGTRRPLSTTCRRPARPPLRLPARRPRRRRGLGGSTRGRWRRLQSPWTHSRQRLHSARRLHFRAQVPPGVRVGAGSARGGGSVGSGLDEPGRGLGLVEHDLRLLHGHRLRAQRLRAPLPAHLLFLLLRPLTSAPPARHGLAGGRCGAPRALTMSRAPIARPVARRPRACRRCSDPSPRRRGRSPACRWPRHSETRRSRPWKT